MQLKRLLRWQLGIAAAVVATALPCGRDVLLSVAIGAGACLLANGFFALRVFTDYSAADPGGLLARIYGAEIAKIVILLTLFSAAFATLDELNLFALFGAYAAVQVVPAVLASRPDARSNIQR